jgi:LmbE family N-acetylglucosaminyl deacetylase
MVLDTAPLSDRVQFHCRAIVDVSTAVSTTSSHAGFREHKRVLAIGAHPDDIEIGCGGALAKHRAHGDEVRILTLTRGAVGGDAQLRAREAQQAADLLGATLHFGDLPDAAIPDGVSTIRMIEAVIGSYAPTHVYTHSLQDTHQDHRSVHHASMVAARDVPHLYCYQSPSSTVDFRPQLFIDISAYIDTKLQLIGAHASQTQRRANIHSDLIVATARYWGRYAGFVLAEPMHIIRQVL